MKLTLKNTYSLKDVINVNRLIDGAISIAEIKGSAAICQGGHCCEVGCRNCPFKSMCFVETSATDMHILKDCFNSFIEHNYFQIRNGN